MYDNNNPNFYNDPGAATRQISCAGGDFSVDYGGSTYKFHLDGTFSMHTDGKAWATIDGGDPINIYPDGKYYNDVFTAYLGNVVWHEWYVTGI